MNLEALTRIVDDPKKTTLESHDFRAIREGVVTIQQLSAEVVKLQGQLEDYKECFIDLAKNRDELWEDLERVTKERDEARREVCAHEADTVEDQREYAAQRGWDCFKEGGK